MSNRQDIARRRLLAFCVDWLVVALWGGALYGVVAITTGGQPPRLATAWQSQIVGLVAMTLPFILYFAACESGARRASLGKRLLGLWVSTESGERLSFRRAFTRNTLKFLPWEAGHTLAHQAIFAGDAGLEPWVFAMAAIAFAGPIWWALEIWFKARAPYDRWACARVARAGSHLAPSNPSHARQPSEATGGNAPLLPGPRQQR